MSASDSYSPQYQEILDNHPYYWSRTDVLKFLSWASEEFKIENIVNDNFRCNGRALCVLTKDDFKQRCQDGGDILYNSVHRFKKTLPYNPGTLKEFYDYEVNESTEAQNLVTDPRLQPHRTGGAEGEDDSSDISGESSTDQCSSPDGSVSREPSTDGGAGSRDGNTPGPTSRTEKEERPLDLRGFQDTTVNTCPRVSRPLEDFSEEPKALANGRLLWEYLWDLLRDEGNKHIIRWVDEEKFIFRIIDPKSLSKLWGSQKNASNSMTYEKLSRALRYYYNHGILQKEPGQKLTYRYVKPPQDIKRGIRGAKPGVPHKRRKLNPKKPGRKSKSAAAATCTATGSTPAASTPGIVGDTRGLPSQAVAVSGPALPSSTPARKLQRILPAPCPSSVRIAIAPNQGQDQLPVTGEIKQEPADETEERVLLFAESEGRAVHQNQHHHQHQQQQPSPPEAPPLIPISAAGGFIQSFQEGQRPCVRFTQPLPHQCSISNPMRAASSSVTRTSTDRGMYHNLEHCQPDQGGTRRRQQRWDPQSFNTH